MRVDDEWVGMCMGNEGDGGCRWLKVVECRLKVGCEV